MSGEKLPILCGSVPSFEMFMSKWEKLVERGGRVGIYAKAGLDWAYGYYGRMDRTRAYIVTMCKCSCAMSSSDN
jgi:hypothetical protein